MKFNGFKYDRCLYCGECFANCPVVNLSIDTAIEEIMKLIRHDVENSIIFSRCTTCNVCNLYCPEDALPYELVLENFNLIAERRGLPFLARLVFPDEPHNMWSLMKHLLPEDEKNLIKKWKINLNNSHETAILAGFYTNLIPYIADTELLGNLRDHIIGYEGLFGSGGDMYKLGLLKKTYQVGLRMKYHLENIGVKKLYTMMEPEAAMLKEVYPQRFGIKFDIEIDTVDNLLLQKIKSGEIKIKKPLNMRVTLHDNCCSRYFNLKPQEISREIIKLTGNTLVEMKHSREKALCCGWAATIPTLYRKKFSIKETLFYLLYSLYVRIKEAEESGADALVTSCHACTIFLTLMAELLNSNLKILHIQELVRLASGEDYRSRINERVWDLLAIVINLVVEWIRSPSGEKYFFSKETPPFGTIEIDASENEIKRTKLVRSSIEKLRKNNLFRNQLSMILKRSLEFYGKFTNRKIEGGNLVGL